MATDSGKIKHTNGIVFYILLAAFLITVLCLIYILFQHSPNNLTIEILASIIAALLVITSVIVSIHLQHESEMHRDFNVELFKKKLDMYQEFIDVVAEADDDGEIDFNEKNKLLNLGRSIALIGSEQLVNAISHYLHHVITTGRTNTVEEEDESESFRNVVTNMREDLAVVEQSEDVKKSVLKLMDLAVDLNGKKVGT